MIWGILGFILWIASLAWFIYEIKRAPEMED